MKDAKSICYVAWTVAALMVIAHNANRPAAAFSPTSAIYGSIIGADEKHILLDDGRIFFGNWTGWVEETNYYPLPVSASQVAVFSFDGESNGPLIIDTTGRGWAYGGGGTWHNIGPLPGFNPTAIEPSTWSGVKVHQSKP